VALGGVDDCEDAGYGFAKVVSVHFFLLVSDRKSLEGGGDF
jgi:hypothetical protein